MTQEVILVDDCDVQIGTADKHAAHLGEGQLHRAFSVHLVDAAGRHLLQRRASGKMLWPGYWSNSCCSHPRPGETISDAAHRRLTEELGIWATCQMLYRFEYHARYGTVGSEHELCYVLIARSDAVPRPSVDEVADWVWLARDEVAAWLNRAPGDFTPWFLMEWQRLSTEFPGFDMPKDAQISS